MSGWKDWAIGEVVTESEFQSFVQDQVVQVYDDATDRDNTLGANVAEGMVCYLKDTDETQVYDGTDWVQVGEGTITEVVAGTALTGGGSSGSVTLNVDESEITLAQSQVTDLVSDLSNKASTTHATTHESGGSDEIEIAQSQVTGLDTGTEGFTALSNGTAGLSYQPVSHNYIINGAFDIWQRGTAESFSGGGSYVADRWLFNPSGGDIDASQQSFTPAEIEAIGFGDAQFFGRIDVTSSDNNIGFVQKIEDVRTLAGQGVTLSFYAKANKSLTVAGSANQVFGSGGSPRVNKGENVSITTSWARYSVNISLDSMLTKTIGTNSYLEVAVAVPATDTFTLDIWGVQLEAGSIATPFKRNANSIAGELAACQRYYQRIDLINSQVTLWATANNTSLITIPYPLTVPLRATPNELDIGDYDFFEPGGSNFDGGSFSQGGSTSTSVIVRYIHTSGTLTAGSTYGLTYIGSGGYIGVDAEL